MECFEGRLPSSHVWPLLILLRANLFPNGLHCTWSQLFHVTENQSFKGLRGVLFRNWWCVGCWTRTCVNSLQFWWKVYVNSQVEKQHGNYIVPCGRLHFSSRESLWNLWSRSMRMGREMSKFTGVVRAANGSISLFESDEGVIEGIVVQLPLWAERTSDSSIRLTYVQFLDLSAIAGFPSAWRCPVQSYRPSQIPTVANVE